MLDWRVPTEERGPMRRRKRHSLCYPKGHKSVSVEAIPCSQILRRGETLEVPEPPYRFADDRCRNGEKMLTRESPN
jgi:hypothetical protein